MTERLRLAIGGLVTLFPGWMQSAARTALTEFADALIEAGRKP